MNKSKLIAGLEVGSSHITCLCVRVNNKPGTPLTFVSGYKQRCPGMKNGIILDIHKTSDVIKAVLEHCEESADDYISEMFVGIHGAHIKTYNNNGVISIYRPNKEITFNDVIGVIENSKALQLSSSMEIIDTIVQGFILDGQEGVNNPVGMDGHFLRVDTHIITASTMSLSDIYKCVVRAGTKLFVPVYSLIPAAELVITPDEKDRGCAVIDFGGQLTGITVYEDNKIAHSRELPFGVDYITKDIAAALKTSFASAELIKHRYGTASPSLLTADTEIEYKYMDNITVQTTTASFVSKVIGARLEELLNYIKKELSPYDELIKPGGIIITGGGSILNGMAESCSLVLELETRQGFPINISGSGLMADPAYSAALGIITHKLKKNFWEEEPHTLSGFTKRFLRKFE